MELEIPLNSDGRIHKERLVAVGVVDEVIADFHLATDAEVFRGIEPDLRLREDNQFTVTVGLLLTPEIDKAREGTLLIGKRRTPHTRQLGTVESAVIV
jgi:hypothetical protein